MTGETKIYADSYQLAVMLFDRTRTFPKHFRPTLARKLEEAAVELVLSVRTASVSAVEKKKLSLARASDRLDEIRVLLQLSHDMHVLNAAGYAEMSSQTAIVGKQIGGFWKAVRTKAQAPGDAKGNPP